MRNATLWRLKTASRYGISAGRTDLAFLVSSSNSGVTATTVHSGGKTAREQSIVSPEMDETRPPYNAGAALSGWPSRAAAIFSHSSRGSFRSQRKSTEAAEARQA